MSLVKLGDFPAYFCHLVLPKIGRGWAELELQQNTETLSAGEKITLSIQSDTGTQSFVGSIDPNRSGVYLSSYKVRFVLGNGGWLSLVSPVHFSSGHMIRDILSAILGSAGETLSPVSDPGLLSTGSNAYTVIQNTCAASVGVLMDTVNENRSIPYSYRFLPDGSFFVGIDTFALSDVEYTVSVKNPENNSQSIELVRPGILPGQSINEGKVNAVEYWIDTRGVRGQILFEDV